MFNWINTNKNKKSELDFITDILFPPIQRKFQDGTEFFVDYSIDANLQAILNDIEDGHVDKITVDNLNYVIDQLHLIRCKYNIHPEIKAKGQTVPYMVSANRE